MEDEGRCVAVDRMGNIYVAGKVKTSSGEFNILVHSYTAAGVARQFWPREWDGPGTDDDDVPTSISVDHDLNVYIAGYTFDRVLGGRGYDMAVIKLTTNNILAWPTDGGGDPGGNGDDPGWQFHQGAFVTTSTDYEGIPPSGVSMAVKDSIDESQRIIAITGARSGGGTLGWRTWVLEQPTSTTVQRKQGWPVNYPSPDIRGRAWGIAIHSDNTIYVCGDEHFLDTGYFFSTVRFKASGGLASGGAIQYHHRYNPYGGKENGARAIVLDPAGNAYVTGLIATTDLPPNQHEPRIATIRLNENLTGVTIDPPAWEDHYGTGSFNVGTSIDLTHEVESGVIKRYVYVTGQAGSDIATLRLSDTGVRQWTNGAVLYNAGLNMNSDAITVPKIYGAGLGNAYVVGTTNTAGTDPRYVGLAYRKDGTTRWTTQTYDGGILHGLDEALWGVMVGPGALLVTGGSAGGTTSADILSQKWTQTVTTYSPDSYSVTRGSLVGGGLSGLTSDDGSYMQFLYGENLNRGPQVQVEFTKAIPSEITPTEITFNVIALTSWAGIDQTFEVYDYTSGSWELVDARDSSATDMKLICVMKSDPHRYMDPLTRVVKVRLSWEETTYTLPRWQAWIEQLTWEVIGN